MNTYYYHIYGLTLASPIEFPEALEVASPKTIDASLSFSAPPDWVLQEYKEGKYASVKQNVMWFRLEEELLIYVANGSDVRVHLLNPNIDPVRMRSYILSGALTFLLFQHNYILIHGSALVFGGKVYIISGPSGSGKSTTALELLKQDSVLFASDDICAVQNIGNQTILYPGPPWQKVCADVQAKNTNEAYTYINEMDGKFGRRLPTGYITEPTPVGGMFILSKESCRQPVLTEFTGVNKLHALTHNLFRGELLHLLGITPQRMTQFLETVKHFPIYNITRPENGDTLSSITQLLLSCIKNITNLQEFLQA